MEWRRDLRIAFRSLGRQPLFALTAIVTLALGIGASTATFGVVHSLLLSPLPYAAPDELALVWGRTRDAPDRRGRIAGEDAVRVIRGAPAIAAAAFVLPAVDVVIGSGPSRSHVRLGRGTSQMFDVLGASPHVGSGFSADIDDPFGGLILSHGFWQDHFGGDVAVVGREVSVNGVSVRVSGVARPGFEVRLPAGAGFATAVGGWLSIGPDPGVLTRPTGLRDQDSDDTGVLIARLAPGGSVGSLNTALDVISARIRGEAPGLSDAGFELFARGMEDDVVRDARQAIIAIACAVGFVLLVACFNVANLLLARLHARSGELAVRAALGAGRGRLIVQAMSEGLVIAVVAGLAGLGLAKGLLFAVRRLGAEPISHIGATLEFGHLAFAALATVAAGLACGLPPALRAAETGRAMLSGGSTRVSGGSIVRARRFLIAGEIALSLVLLTGAGLLLRSFVELQRVDSGFDAQNLVTFGVTLPPGTIGGPGARAEFMREIADAVRSTPGVRAVGLSGALPLTGAVWTQPWGLASQTPAEWERNSADFRVVSSDYFAAVGTRLMAGRVFSAEEDVNEAGRVVIVDRELAQMIAAGDEALGQTIGFPLDGRPVYAEIVGIVEPVRHASLREAGRPTLYVPYRQEASRAVGFAVRTAGNVTTVLPSIREAVGGAIAGTPAILHDERLMSEWVERSTARERFTFVVAAAFAAVALVLAAVGLYGVIAFLVSRRTRELGIRSALGASAADITTEVLRDGIRLAGTGVGIGLVLAIAFSLAIRPLLFGVGFIDPLTLLVVAATLGAVVLAACWAPARRAGRIQPIVALRID